jgi:hypothetical protein
MSRYSLLGTERPEGMLADWYLVFRPAEKKLWIHKWLDEEFGHVLMIRFDGRHWILVDGRSGSMDVVVLPYGPNDRIRDIVKSGRILWVNRWRPDKLRKSIMPTTCVEVVKMALGIDKPWILTPKQLWKYLGGKDG